MEKSVKKIARPLARGFSYFFLPVVAVQQKQAANCPLTLLSSILRKSNDTLQKHHFWRSFFHDNQANNGGEQDEYPK
jgi:hypothetical protein